MHYTIDITKETCPMTFVKVKLQMAKMTEGDTLEVLLTQGEPLENVPGSAEESGYSVLGIEPTDRPHIHKVLLKK